MTDWTTNLVPNPSFELGLDNYAPVGQSTLTWQPDGPAVFGNFALQVDTDGSAAGQGFLMAGVPVTPGPYTASLHATGSGVFDVAVVTNPGGVIRGHITVSLTSDWQRYVLPAVTLDATATSVYLLVRTTTPAITTVLIDGVQIEPKATATDYCDGDQYGCVWQGDPHNSISSRAIPYPIIASGGGSSAGEASAYVPGPVLVAVDGAGRSSGSAAAIVGQPWGAVDDFAVYGLADTDPVKGASSGGNAGTNSGAFGAAWTRHYAQFTAPVDYSVSSGVLTRRAAYVAAGFQFTGIPATQLQHLDAVQLEFSDQNHPGSGQPILPTAFTPPRQMRVRVKPDRINLSINPSFVASVNNWPATGSCTITQDTTTGVVGSTSAKINATADGTGTYIQHNVSGLIYGEPYTFSCWFKRDENIRDITLQAPKNGATASMLYFGTGSRYIPYGAGQYGDGPYGGDTGIAPPPVGDWVQVWFTFRAINHTETFRVFPHLTTPGAPGNFWLDRVLIEQASAPGAYFDGGSGADYLWNPNFGTPNESQSWYYRDRVKKTYVVSQLIADNTPVGITAVDPVIAELADQ